MQLVIGKKYTGQVTSILPYGAVLQFEDGSTQLLHISNMSDGFVSNIEDFVMLGQPCEVTAVPGSVKDIEITLRDPSNYEGNVKKQEEEEEDFATMVERYLPKEGEYRPRNRYNKGKNGKRKNNRNRYND